MITIFTDLLGVAVISCIAMVLIALMSESCAQKCHFYTNFSQEQKNSHFGFILIYSLVFALLAAILTVTAYYQGKMEVENAFQAHIDQHFMNQKFASTFKAEIKMEYFEGKLRSIDLVPGTTKYVRP